MAVNSVRIAGLNAVRPPASSRKFFVWQDFRFDLRLHRRRITRATNPSSEYALDRTDILSGETQFGCGQIVGKMGLAPGTGEGNDMHH